MKDRLQCFGVWDFYISDNCDQNSNSVADLGACYTLPLGMKHKSEAASEYLAGSQNFKVIELELFQVIYED